MFNCSEKVATLIGPMQEAVQGSPQMLWSDVDLKEVVSSQRNQIQLIRMVLHLLRVGGVLVGVELPHQIKSLSIIFHHHQFLKKYGIRCSNMLLHATWVATTLFFSALLQTQETSYGRDTQSQGLSAFPSWSMGPWAGRGVAWPKLLWADCRVGQLQLHCTVVEKAGIGWY